MMMMMMMIIIIIIIIIIIKRQFLRRSYMARVTTRAPYNVPAHTLETVSEVRT